MEQRVQTLFLNQGQDTRAKLKLDSRTHTRETEIRWNDRSISANTQRSTAGHTRHTQTKCKNVKPYSVGPDYEYLTLYQALSPEAVAKSRRRSRVRIGAECEHTRFPT